MGQVWSRGNQTQAVKAVPGQPDEKPVVVQEVEVVAAETGGRALTKPEDWEDVPMPSPTAPLPDEEGIPVTFLRSPMVVAAKDGASEERRDEGETAPDRRWHPSAVLSMLSLGLLAFYRSGRSENGTKSGDTKRKKGCNT